MVAGRGHAPASLLTPDPAPRTPRDPAEDAATLADLPDATVGRLPQYLDALSALAESGRSTVSSDALAAAAGVGSATLRKDLSHLGSYGTRGVGYDIATLHAQLAGRLGDRAGRRVVIVGIGNLGHALAGYGGFASRGFRVVGLFDDAPDVVGTVVTGLRVEPVSRLGAAVAELGATIGVLAVPGWAAQTACDELVAAGVRSVLNFAPVALRVGADVDVRRVDLASELQILSFRSRRRDRATEAVGSGPTAGSAPRARSTVAAPGPAPRLVEEVV